MPLPLPQVQRLILPALAAFFFISFPYFQTASAPPDRPPYKDIFETARPSIRTLTNADGLPVNSVMTIERDSKGFVWFGTQDGAAVYDGSEFRVVDMPNRAASNYIYDILVARDGSVWFGTNGGGVHRLNDGNWATFNKAGGLGSDEIRALLETPGPEDEPVIWVGRRDGLSKYEKGVWTNIGVDDGLPDSRVRSLMFVPDEAGAGEVWIGTYGGIAIWNGSEFRNVGVADGLPGETIFALETTRSGEGERVIWAGTDKGLASFEKGKWISHKEEDDVFSSPVRALGSSSTAAGDQAVWVGFDGAGLAYGERGAWKFVDKSKGLPNDLVYAFEETGSPDGSVWISNLTAGISRLQRSDWRTIDETNGLPNEIVFSVAESADSDQEPSYFVATYGGGLAVFADGKWKVITTRTGLPSDFVQKVKDAHGRLLIGTEEGLSEYVGGQLRPVELPDEQGVFEIWDIEPSQDGSSVWLGTSGGLVLLSDTGSKVYTSETGLPDRRVRTVTEYVDSEGRRTVWIGTYTGGLARLRDGKWKSYGSGNGLLSSRIYSVARVAIGGRDQLWVGTGGGGIGVLDLGSEDEQFELLTADGGLIPSDTVYRIFTGPKGRVYATTNKGVARIRPAPEGSLSELSSYVFTTRDGLPDNECVSGSGFVDRRGRVWVGTVSGAAVLDTSTEFIDNIADPIFIRRIRVAGEEREAADGMEIPYDRNNLTFEFVMPTSLRESATAYRTQMAGLEEGPTAWTNETKREFSFVPAGDYEFRAWARDAEGNVSGPVAMSFTVHPAWWQTWWAIGLYFLATAAVVFLIAYLVYRNRYVRLLEIERVRTRIASDLHDDVGASLSKISIISEMLAHDGDSRAREEKESLLKIAETSRDVVGSMSDMVWSINPVKDNTRDTVQRMRRFASDVLGGRNIEFTLEAPAGDDPRKLSVDLRRNLYLVFKESVNNAAKYSDCKSVEIGFQIEGREIVLRVSDDGKGFDPGAVTRGNGLRNLRERMESLGGNLKIESSPGAGTRIVARAPLRS